MYPLEQPQAIAISSWVQVCPGAVTFSKRIRPASILPSLISDLWLLTSLIEIKLLHATTAGVLAAVVAAKNPIVSSDT